MPEANPANFATLEKIGGNRLLKLPITPYRLIIKFRFNSLALTSR